MLSFAVISYLVILAYFSLVLIPIFASIGLPIPEELVLMSAGYLSYTGFVRADLAFILCFIGIIAGDNLTYVIGRHGGRIVQKIISARRVRKAQCFFDKHGAKAVFFGRFLVGPRFWMPLIAGMSGMKWKTFFTYTALGAIIVVPFYMVLGYFVGKNLKHIIAISHELSDFVVLSLLIIAAAVCIYICVYRRHFRQKMREDDFLDAWLEKDKPYQVATFVNPETGDAKRFIAKIRPADGKINVIVSQVHEGAVKRFIKLKRWITLKRYNAMIKWQARLSKPKIEKWE